VLTGPAYFPVDVGVSRRMTIKDRLQVIFQAQVFNLFNRTQFDLPERFVDEPATFGRIQSAKPARQIQLAVRLRF
jgi:hypothetical protein